MEPASTPRSEVDVRGAPRSAPHAVGAVEAVLAGQVHYDQLTDTEQSAVRDAWEGQIVTAIRHLDYQREFVATGEPWAEADSLGQLRVRSC